MRTWPRTPSTAAAPALLAPCWRCWVTPSRSLQVVAINLEPVLVWWLCAGQEPTREGNRGKFPGNFGLNSLVKILRCSSATCAGQSTAEHPWHMHPSSLTTATAMGSVLLAGRHHFIVKTPSLVTTVKFLHKAKLSSISLVRNQAPMIASARGLTGPCSTKGYSSSLRAATCSKG